MWIVKSIDYLGWPVADSTVRAPCCIRYIVPARVRSNNQLATKSGFAPPKGDYIQTNGGYICRNTCR
jgi:hypothetical protein